MSGFAEVCGFKSNKIADCTLSLWSGFAEVCGFKSNLSRSLITPCPGQASPKSVDLNQYVEIYKKYPKSQASPKSVDLNDIAESMTISLKSQASPKSVDLNLLSLTDVRAVRQSGFAEVCGFKYLIK